MHSAEVRRTTTDLTRQLDLPRTKQRAANTNIPPRMPTFRVSGRRWDMRALLVRNLPEYLRRLRPEAGHETERCVDTSKGQREYTCRNTLTIRKHHLRPVRPQLSARGDDDDHTPNAKPLTPALKLVRLASSNFDSLNGRREKKRPLGLMQTQN